MDTSSLEFVRWASAAATARTRLASAAAIGALVLATAGCAMQPRHADSQSLVPVAYTLPQARDLALEQRILALDPERVTEIDVRNVLAKGPTPRIMLLHGGIYPVHLSMESFGNFLAGMGYPEARIREPNSGGWSHSPYEDAERLAGKVAWYYENDGMPPMLIGHSQGGMQAVKVLHVLKGEYSPEVPVWNPMTEYPEDRTYIVDPLTGERRPVVGGVKVSYVSAVGAGGAAFLLPNQWSLIGKLRTIPDTVEEFVGYAIDLDLWAWTVPGVDATRTFASGAARVRNVTLRADTNHVLVPVTADLAEDAIARDRINAYVPGDASAIAPDSAGHLLWAADVWHSVKRHWVLAAQRYLRDHPAGPDPTVATGLR